jgi:hypothetical protein
MGKHICKGRRLAGAYLVYGRCNSHPETVTQLELQQNSWEVQRELLG